MSGGISSELRPLVDDPRMAMRPPPPHVPIAKFRAAADGFLASAQGPALAAVCDYTISSAAGLRFYRPSANRGLPVVVFIHGGGFVFGGLETHDALCRRLAVATGVAVASVRYRLAPEAAFPDPLDDCCDVVHWLHRHAAKLDIDEGRLALVGDSAGGQLATAAALLLSQQGVAMRHLGLFYPLIDPSCSSTSMTAFDGLMLTRGFLRWCWEVYRSKAAEANPLFDLRRADLGRLPPVTLVTAEFDPLRDEGEMLADGLRAAGVPVAARCYPGMIHGFAGLPLAIPQANEAIGLMAGNLRAALTA